MAKADTTHDAVPGGNKDPCAVTLGRRGGRKRASSMTPAERSELARKAALARWRKGKK